MVKKGYEHVDITFSQNNEKEMKLYKWLDKKSGILNTSTLVKVLLFELMNKEEGSEKWAFIFFLKIWKVSELFCIHIYHSNKKGDIVMERLRIVLEFSKGKIEDLVLFNELNKYSNPSAHVKDILKGLVPLPTLNTNKELWGTYNVMTLYVCAYYFGGMKYFGESGGVLNLCLKI